jgi:hypothetical protein
VTQKFLKDVAASVRQRQLNLARERNEQFQLVLNRYAIERLLFRLSRSDYRSEFVVKGATLFALWSGHPHRPTRDLDLLGLGEEDAARAAAVFQVVCRAAVADDGLAFGTDSISVEPLRGGADFQGLRVVVEARLGTARTPVQIDIGFGDPVTPPAEEAEFPVLLDFPPPRLLVYRRETVIAEKFDAMVKLGMANSRMKDFFDIWFLANNFPFAGTDLSLALKATLARRASPSIVQPIAFTPEFFEDSGKIAQWKAFHRKGGLDGKAPALAGICVSIEEFLRGPVRATLVDQSFGEVWRPGGPWVRTRENTGAPQ